MGWALDNLSADARARIARSLFVVESEDAAWLNGLCPFHDDSMPSFGYNVTDDVFKCLAACTDSGDLVDLWCLVNGYAARSPDGFKAFKRAFADEIGVGGPRRKTPGQLKAKERREQGKGRKPIPEEVYTAQGPVPDDMVAELRIRRGWNRETMDELGIRLLTHYRRKSEPYKVFPIRERDRLVFPVRDADGVLWNLRTYYPFGVPENSPPKTAKIISWAMGHGYSRLFPSPAMLEPAGPVLLCEGEPDTVCARSQGIRNAFTQTSKTTHFPDDQIAAIAGRTIYIAYDADQAGMEYAQKTAKSLYRAGFAVHIVEWPDYMGRLPDGSWPEDHGQDLTDFFVRHHKALPEFMMLLDKAPLYNPHAPHLSAASDDANPKPAHRFWHDSVNGRKSFSERLLADYLIKEHAMLYHDKSGQLYRWEGTYFEPWSEAQLRKAATEALEDEASAARVNASCSLVMNLVSMPHGRDLNDRQDWVCLQNGMLHLYTQEFVPHSPDFLSTIKLPVSWHGDDTPIPKRFLKYLDETVETPEVIDQLQEFLGLSMTRKTNFGKALLLFGPGSDGKSKFIATMRAIIGPQNCSAVSMTGLEDQFQRAGLFGKLLNVATEMPTDAMKSEMFKAVVTGDPIQASFKHKDSFEFLPFAKFVYATNKMPRVSDNSDGYFRRILPVRFKHQFLEDNPKMDPDLEDKLMAELDGIFAWALIGLQRLMEQKRFTVCEETLNFMMKYRRYNNPVMAFVQDRCSLENSEKEEKVKDLYREYRTYCKDGGFSPLNRENFIEELLTASRKIKEDAAIRRYRPRRDNERPDVVHGIYITNNPDLFGNSDDSDLEL